jgi:hypothetical protein
VRGALQLLAVGVLHIRDPLTNLPQRITVAKPPRVQHRVNRKRHRLQRSEQKLRAGTRELRGLRKRPQREHRLKRAALLTIHDQRPLTLGDRRVRAPREVHPQRLKHTAPPILARAEEQRVGLPVLIEQGLRHTPRGGPPQEPLKLAGTRALDAEHPGQPLEDALLARQQPLKLTV